MRLRPYFTPVRRVRYLTGTEVAALLATPQRQEREPAATLKKSPSHQIPTPDSRLPASHPMTPPQPPPESNNAMKAHIVEYESRRQQWQTTIEASDIEAAEQQFRRDHPDTEILAVYPARRPSRLLTPAP